uniref:Uncharacterized protein n=1 Tax=Physcomitrium patens TaxID=3218 RepID=A0A2K1K5P7_PHYPA|nr:hypothetical protein PHYPA_010995 [Physcomitrium patens]
MSYIVCGFAERRSNCFACSTYIVRIQFFYSLLPAFQSCLNNYGILAKGGDQHSRGEEPHPREDLESRLEKQC